ncbi:MAG: hypothetical protein JOY82_24830 [Streptosporangiaceae bacterium]|nr:hypothetical protein [Streptosporangiaceae bacterium]MBV9857710.1 hypothetical protein [Streptosporangiaceae bacterium]
MSGPDPAQLHSVARQLRSIASSLDEPVASVLRKYPQGSIWVGSAANQFYGELQSARNGIDQCASDLENYAAALEKKANQPAT